MKTSVIEVHDMLAVLTVDEVEERIGSVAGVDSVTVNYAAANATVRYDETRLEVGDIRVLMHQRGPRPAGEALPVDGNEHEPARKPDAVPTPKVAPASASKPEAAMPKPSTGAAAAVLPVAAPAAAGQQDKRAPIAQPSTPDYADAKAAPAAAAPIVRAGDGQQGKATTDTPTPASSAAPPKPSPVAPAAKPSTPATAEQKASPDAKAPTSTAAEPNTGSWKVHGLSLMVTVSVAYALCATVDVLVSRFGLLAALAPAGPLPISGSPLAYLTGFALFAVAGFVFGAVHGVAWDFWSKRLR